MIKTTYVDAREPSIARLLPGFTGHEAKIRPDLDADPFEFQGNYWSGGCRNSYTVVEVATGRAATLPGINPLTQRDGAMAIPQGFAVVEYSMFCGKHMPPTIHTHPSDLAGALPEPVEVPESWARCLIATSSLKNTYGGETGIRQKHSGLDLDQWETAKLGCIGKGWMRRNGAITREGRNVIECHPLRHSIS